MNKIFELSTKRYEPISIGSSYLFEQHHAIVSFLKSKLDSYYINKLSSPKLIERDEIVEWYANSSGTFSTIDSLSEEQQIEIKKKYWELKFKINEIIQSLSNSSKGSEANQWIEILNATFSENDNLLLSNGEDFFIIWGWKFNSGVANYLEPQFLPNTTTIVENPLASDDNALDSENNFDDNSDSIKNEDPIVNSENEDTNSEAIEKNKEINVILTTTEGTNIPTEDNNINESEIIDKPEVPTIRKLTFWERIKRFFRWISYRFWALMLLIIFILLLCCLCKNCSAKKVIPCDNCKELDSINQRLEETKIRLKENCPPN
jgi:hypothetical protein